LFRSVSDWIRISVHPRHDRLPPCAAQPHLPQRQSRRYQQIAGGLGWLWQPAGY